MNADALMAEVLANPDDDTPRLILADWLEEHSETDRATFIRLQVKQARIEPPSTEHHVLGREAHELLERHCDAWLADLPRGLRSSAQFHRGFVGVLKLTASALLRVSKRVWDRHPIQELALSGVTGQLDRVLALSYLPRVRRLLLHAGRFSDSDLASLARCPTLGGLRHLTILSFNGNAVAQALAANPSLTGLTSLRLDDRWLNDEGVAILVGSRNVGQLTRLDLGGGAEIGAAGARAIAQAPGLGALTFLLLSAGPIGDEGLAALAGGPSLSGLRTLWLAGHRIGPEGARALAATTHLTHLDTLHLDRNSLGPEGARALANAPLRELTRLELGWCNLDGEGAAALAASPVLAGLHSLSLRGNRIGDEGARALCASRTLAQLRTLTLTRCGPFSPAVEAALRQRFGQGVTL
jgi:uncharacterized protein (TIGR02996 family)